MDSFPLYAKTTRGRFPWGTDSTALLKKWKTQAVSPLFPQTKHELTSERWKKIPKLKQRTMASCGVPWFFSPLTTTTTANPSAKIFSIFLPPSPIPGPNIWIPQRSRWLNIAQSFSAGSWCLPPFLSSTFLPFLHSRWGHHQHLITQHCHPLFMDLRHISCLQDPPPPRPQGLTATPPSIKSVTFG